MRNHGAMDIPLPHLRAEEDSGVGVGHDLLLAEDPPLLLVLADEILDQILSKELSVRGGSKSQAHFGDLVAN